MVCDKARREETLMMYDVLVHIVVCVYSKQCVRVYTHTTNVDPGLSLSLSSQIIPEVKISIGHSLLTAALACTNIYTTASDIIIILLLL